VYFRDVDDRKELKVARSYAGEGMLQLLPGDLIRQVVGVDGKIENETQLLHALRGQLDGARLLVVRSGQDLVVEGAKPPMRPVLETRGLYASGVLFGPVTIRDAPEIDVRGLMVHFVESGSIGESREIEKSDLLEAVDGTPVPDLETLHAMLRDAAQSGRLVTLTFKRLAGGDSLFSYTQRTMPVTEPRLIGPQPATRHAEAPLQ
jgi:membrane-associated protease RseP (regulator of RpoE activity)